MSSELNSNARIAAAFIQAVIEAKHLFVKVAV